MGYATKQSSTGINIFCIEKEKIVPRHQMCHCHLQGYIASKQIVIYYKTAKKAILCKEHLDDSFQFPFESLFRYFISMLDLN